MIPFFVGYAFLVWYFTARFRRTVYALVVIALGVGGLLFLNYLHWLMGQYEPELMIQGLQLLMYPYTAMVGAMALFISALPRRFPPGLCARCEYDLAGLGHPVDRCPECGLPTPPAPVVYRPSGVERVDLRASDSPGTGSASPRAEAGAGQQNQARNPAEQDPADR